MQHKNSMFAICKIDEDKFYHLGELSFRGIVVPDAIPAIVPKDLFDRVQSVWTRISAPLPAAKPTRNIC